MINIMKKLICSVLCIVLLGMSVSVCAEDAPGAMNASWSAQYGQTPVLTITFTSPAPYAQQVTAVMYPANAANPTILDYCRMGEVTSLYGAQTTISFSIGDDLNASDGKYKVKLQGNGVLSAESMEIIDVDILSPLKVASLLGRINMATTTSQVAELLAEGNDALQLNLETDPTTLDKLMSAFLEIKANDYQNNFTDLNSVREAYNKSDILVCLKDSATTGAVLRAKVEANATLLGIDILGADYLTVAESVYNKVVSVKNTYNSTGITSISLLVDAVKSTVAVEMVNKSTIEGLYTVIDNYYLTLGITNDKYSSYSAYTDANKQKVLRQIYNKNFTFASNIKTAFENGVDGALTEDTTQQQTPVIRPVGGLGGGGGGGSYGGGSTSGETVTKPALTDVSSSHWAYSYVEELNKTGIISGYPDGSFKPESTVTREEFVKMIISAAGLYDAAAECDFDDIDSSAWYYKFVASAKQIGVVGGISQTSFGQGQNITRQDVAVIVARLVDRFKKTNSASAAEAQTAYKDDAEIASYAKASVNVLKNYGIIAGFEDGSFMPAAYLTRAQAAKIIYMFRENI